MDCIKPLLIAGLALLLGGCAGMQSHTKSSVVEYLYSDQKENVIQPSVPRLKLPVKVGIAFVPEGDTRGGTSFWTGQRIGNGLTEADKMTLMQQVADHFGQYDFVDSIEIIPSAYLTAKGGFANLDQIRTMYGVDIIALVSYDQVQFVDEGAASVTYWTLIGAYVVSGEKNDTSTMLDTAVFDIASRKLLFRAPGVSRVQGKATAVNLSEQLRKDSLQGFKEATRQMIENLDQQLELFKEKVKARPEEYQISHHSGYGGGGAFGQLSLALMIAWGGWLKGMG